jgi:hypothetical protein
MVHTRDGHLHRPWLSVPQWGAVRGQEGCIRTNRVSVPTDFHSRGQKQKQSMIELGRQRIQGGPHGREGMSLDQSVGDPLKKGSWDQLGERKQTVKV